VYRLLGQLWREGRSVLCISHDVNLLHQVGDAARLRVVGLDAGRLVFDTPFDSVALPERIAELFGAEMESVQGSEQRWIVPRRRSPP
jgi:iron complex transport system ATP-binding protein